MTKKVNNLKDVISQKAKTLGFEINKRKDGIITLFGYATYYIRPLKEGVSIYVYGADSNKVKMVLKKVSDTVSIRGSDGAVRASHIDTSDLIPLIKKCEKLV